MKRLVIVLLLLGASAAHAHEVRPAYLQLHEETPGVFRVLWKTPMRRELRLSLDVQLSGRNDALTPVIARRIGDAAVATWRLRAVEPLRGQSVRIAGLEATMTDALVRIEFADGTSWIKHLTPTEPAANIPERPGRWSVARQYIELGIEHILLGVDHLLFVLALLLITRSGVRLIKTVTAFTVAHSVTLAAATLGFLHVPSAPVEAVIALSIVFVAAEIVHFHRGREGVAARAPWVVAFAFGLLHGLGFAGALREVGLPAGHIPLALLFFNVGVEAGQLLFVAAVYSLIASARRIGVTLPRWAELTPAYAIGILAMFWVIERVAAF